MFLEGQEKRVYRTSCRHCHCECGVLVTVEKGKVTRIVGDKDNPVTKGYVCPKGTATRELVNHPDRVKHPLKKNKRGNWEQVSWGEALQYIAEKMLVYKKSYGAEAVAFMQGTGRGSWFPLFVRLINAFGSPNWGEPGWAQCFVPRLTSSFFTFGSGAMECPDIENTRCLTIWGANPAATWPAKWYRMLAALRRGSKLIVVDPVKTEAAERADLWLQIRPATDAALALGILNVMVFENLFDRSFVAQWTFGFPELCRRLEAYPPEKVAEITWVPVESIRQAAYMMVENNPSSIFQCVAIDQNNNTIQTSRAIALIQALTGNVDNPGGNFAPMSAGHLNTFDTQIFKPDLLSGEQREKRMGAGRYRVLVDEKALGGGAAHMPSLWQTILTGSPYPVKAGIIFGSNPAVSWANSNEVEAALRKLEFKVVVDLFVTKTAEMADMVLPVTSWLETDDITDSLQATYGDIYVRQKVMETPECKTDREIIFALAHKLQLGEFFPWKNDAEYLDHLLRPLGLSFAEFKQKGIIRVPYKYHKYMENGFDTPSRKVELYSLILKNLSYDPLPYYAEPQESPYSTPDLAKKFPLVLTTGGRVIFYRHTEMRNIPSLRRREPEPFVDIHPATAKSLSINDGDWVAVESSRGRIEIRARLCEGIDPRVVQICPGWPGKANVNYLTENKHCSPDMGTTPLRGLLCNVYKIN
ncbi:MAG: molybdopterin-dependent oxidoreductase [Bacillota bacterium]